MNISIKNGRLVDPRNHIDAATDVFIAEGRIVALGKVLAGYRA